MYIYNITINAPGNIGRDVLYFIQHRLFPEWQERDGWDNGRLLRIPQSIEDGVAIAVQFELKERALADDFDIESDACVQRIRQAYGQYVLFYPTIMEVIA